MLSRALNGGMLHSGRANSLSFQQDELVSPQLKNVDTAASNERDSDTHTHTHTFSHTRDMSQMLYCLRRIHTLYISMAPKKQAPSISQLIITSMPAWGMLPPTNMNVCVGQLVMRIVPGYQQSTLSIQTIYHLRLCTTHCQRSSSKPFDNSTQTDEETQFILHKD